MAEATTHRQGFGHQAHAKANSYPSRGEFSAL